MCLIRFFVLIYTFIFPVVHKHSHNPEKHIIPLIHFYYTRTWIFQGNANFIKQKNKAKTLGFGLKQFSFVCYVQVHSKDVLSFCCKNMLITTI